MQDGSDARGEVDQTQNAAAATISELRARLGAVERTASLHALEAAATERDAANVAVAALTAELDAYEHLTRVNGAPHLISAAPTAAAAAPPPAAPPAAQPTVQSASRDEMEALEMTLMKAHAAHAVQLGRAAAALEAEAEACAMLHALEERHAREAIDSKRQIAALQREVQALTRMGAQAGGRSDSSAPGDGTGVAAAVAALSPEALRTEVVTQHATLDALSEALSAAEERVHELERYADLAREAGVE